MLLHRRTGASPIGEAQAYAHLHGDRSGGHSSSQGDGERPQLAPTRPTLDASLVPPERRQRSRSHLS